MLDIGKPPQLPPEILDRIRFALNPPASEPNRRPSPAASEAGDRAPVTALVGDPLPAGPDQAGVSRRSFLRQTGLLAAAVALAAEWPALLGVEQRGAAFADPPPDPNTLDTLSGLVAFIVPGPDPYSLHQGVSTPEPGGIAAAGTPGLFFGLNMLGLAPPPFPGFADLVAFILNQVALAINPAPVGPFPTPFANLAFGEKVAVFFVMEAGLAGPELVPLGGALPFLAGFVSYSEVGVTDPATGALLGQPVGWDLTGYDGVADGRPDFEGYFRNRRKAE